MFGWGKRRAAQKFLAADVGRTLLAVMSLPAEVQRHIASQVSEALEAATTDLKARYSEDIYADHLRKVTAKRHVALAAGATDYRDPTWAAAALTEAWLMAFSPKFNRKFYVQINGAVVGWTTSVLGARDRRS